MQEMAFRLEFSVDRMSLRLMHRAVEHAAVDDDLECVLFPKRDFSYMPLKDPSKLIIK